MYNTNYDNNLSSFGHNVSSLLGSYSYKQGINTIASGIWPWHTEYKSIHFSISVSYFGRLLLWYAASVVLYLIYIWSE